MNINLWDQRYNSLLGNKFGRLYILDHYKNLHGIRYLRCKCDCGKIVNKKLHSLRSGNCSSCGCLRSEMVAFKNKKHGFAQRGKQSEEYKIWKKIKERCFNKKCKAWKYYGARGIGMHSSWLNDFPLFLTHVGQRPSKDHSIDRINNNGNYEPSNVRWATRSQQMRNYRRNHRIEFLGENLTKTEWSERLGIHIDCLNYRLDNWHLSDALTRKRRIYPNKL